MNYTAILIIVITAVLQLKYYSKKLSRTGKVLYITVMLISVVYAYAITRQIDIWVPEKVIGIIFEPIAKLVFGM
ncbi:MAG: hypothetical protein ACOZCL_13885 [Bacillota bacterium]